MLTICLPLYCSEKIAKLAFEGLCRQNKPPVDWELIIIQDKVVIDGIPRMVSFREIQGLDKKLKEKGCDRIVCIETQKRMALSEKWQVGAISASNCSELFLLQAADDFMYPDRLKDAYKKHREHGADWYHVPLALFYDFSLKRFCVYDVREQNHRDRPKTFVNIAIRTELVRHLRVESIDRYVDHWLLGSCEDVKRAPLTKVEFVPRKWLQGCFTNGYNFISTNRGAMIEKYEYPFREPTPDELKVAKKFKGLFSSLGLENNDA